MTITRSTTGDAKPQVWVECPGLVTVTLHRTHEGRVAVIFGSQETFFRSADEFAALTDLLRAVSLEARALEQGRYWRVYVRPGAAPAWEPYLDGLTQTEAEGHARRLAAGQSHTQYRATSAFVEFPHPEVYSRCFTKL